MSMLDEDTKTMRMRIENTLIELRKLELAIKGAWNHGWRTTRSYGVGRDNRAGPRGLEVAQLVRGLVESSNESEECQHGAPEIGRSNRPAAAYGPVERDESSPDQTNRRRYASLSTRRVFHKLWCRSPDLTGSQRQRAFAPEA